jgi:hypothetical protein
MFKVVENNVPVRSFGAGMCVYSPAIACGMYVAIDLPHAASDVKTGGVNIPYPLVPT